jgi:hypothetical protein
VPSVQDTAPPASTPPADSESTVTPDGSVSSMVTPVASAVPLFA